MTYNQKQKNGEKGNKKSLRGCMVVIRDANYIFQSMVKVNILAYFSFFSKLCRLSLTTATVSIKVSHQGIFNIVRLISDI